MEGEQRRQDPFPMKRYTLDEFMAFAAKAGVLNLQEETENGTCFECGSVGQVHRHHVVPRSLGGNKTVPLCEGCHGKVHGMKFTDHGLLTRSGLAEARRRGRTLGRPTGSIIAPADLLRKHADIVKLLKAGQSVRHVAKITGKSKGTVEKVRAVWKA